ncbi:ubiquitin-like protein 7 isoform X2 [Watersipora subatra]
MEVDEDSYDVTVRLFNSRDRSSHSLAVNNGNTSLDQFKELICTTFEQLQGKTVVLVYCGRRLRPGSNLADYNIKSGSCINVLVRDVNQTERSVTRTEGKEAIRKMFSSSDYYMSKQVLLDPKNVNELTRKLPTLEGDLVAQGLLKDPSLLKMLVTSARIDCLLDKHPCIADAAVQISQLVEQKKKIDNSIYTPVPADPRARYTLDALSDEEEEEEASPPPTHRITTDQLSAALALTQEGAARGPSTSASTSAQSSSAQVHPQAEAAQSQQETASQSRYDSQLQQMVSMGIADRALALRALEASGGNVALAVDIIYGGDI